MSPKMQLAMQIVSRHLDAIERDVFKPGMRLTFIARDPTNPEADFLMSGDDLDEVAEVLIRSSKREDVRPALGDASTDARGGA
jgi:hypothetical protein